MSWFDHSKRRRPPKERDEDGEHQLDMFKVSLSCEVVPILLCFFRVAPLMIVHTSPLMLVAANTILPLMPGDDDSLSLFY